MKNQFNTSRRNFIKKGTIAAAGSIGLLSLDLEKAVAHELKKQLLMRPKPDLGHIYHIPLSILGLPNIPAIPFVIEGIDVTLLLLGARSYEVQQAKNGLNNVFTIGGQTATGFAFMYGRAGQSTIAADDRDALKELFASTSDITSLFGQIKDLLTKADRSTISLSDDPITRLSLDSPDQFALSETTFYNVYQKASANMIPLWAKTLTDVDVATKEFWPTISKYGMAYNLLMLQKVNHQKLNQVTHLLGSGISDHLDLDQMAMNGNLFMIDLTLFHGLAVQTIENAPRFTPATMTLLQQDPNTKELTPFTIIVSGQNAAGSQTFVKDVCTDGAWLYALQAAKVSLTVYGIWIGHVYHFHIVTASMVMTMYNNLGKTHPLRLLLDKQSQYLIEFNEVLLLLWRSIAPPSSVTSGWQLLNLLDGYATNRKYFDDDPLSTLNNQGLKQEDFTSDPNQPWNQYPIVGSLLEIWKSTNQYVTAVINSLYTSDADVASDSDLQAWMTDASDPDGGNIKGLPTMDNKAALINMLTSYVYRITAHGVSRLIDSANPSLTFVSNFPPCLQIANIPSPTANLSTEDLMKFLPNTGTIGEMIAFYYIFAFSAPYDSFIPVEGIDTNFFFPNGTSDPKNAALIQFRKDIQEFIEKFTANARLNPFPPDQPQYQQWPANIET